MKTTIKRAMAILLYINVGMWMGMLIAEMILPLILRFYSTSELADRLVRIFGFLIVVSFVLFYSSYKDYYKSIRAKRIERWCIRDIVFPLTLALVIQFLISSIFGYVMYLTGAGYYLGWLLYNVDEIVLLRTDVPTVYYIYGTLITYPFYLFAIILGSKMGANAAKKSIFQLEK